MCDWVNLNYKLKHNFIKTDFSLSSLFNQTSYAMRRKIIPYNPGLKKLARQLRNSSTRSEIILWQFLKQRQRHGFDFHRQKPIDKYIVDFFCHELMLAIELDGSSHWEGSVIEKDMLKTSRLNNMGITVLRFEDVMVFDDVDYVLKKIDEFILSKGHTPNPSQEGD